MPRRPVEMSRSAAVVGRARRERGFWSAGGHDLSEPRPGGKRRGRSRQHGFTMIELLVAMVISGLIVGSLFQLFSGHSRFVQMQNSREEVQQNARVAVELIGSELRTLPAGETLVAAAEDSITFRASRMWGVVCAVPSANQVNLAVPAISDASYSTNGGTGLMVNVGSTATPVWTAAVSATAIGAATGSCGGETLNAGVEMRSLTLSAQPLAGGVGPSVGDVAFVFDEVTYRTGTSSGVPGLWIQRRLGSSSNQPLAGPIDTGGLKFAYFDTISPSSPLSTPVSLASKRAEVGRVQLVVRAIGRNTQAGDRELEVDTVIISLRNRI